MLLAAGVEALRVQAQEREHVRAPPSTAANEKKGYFRAVYENHAPLQVYDLREERLEARLWGSNTPWGLAARRISIISNMLSTLNNNSYHHMRVFFFYYVSQKPMFWKCCWGSVVVFLVGILVWSLLWFRC